MSDFDEEKQKKQLEELHKQEEEQLVATLAESKYHLPYIDLYRLGIDNEALRAISEKDAKEMMRIVEVALERIWEVSEYYGEQIGTKGFMK